jgi:hypothetical protein
LREELLSVADLSRQRADAENVHDELKNQWSWGGFSTQDLLRCGVSARHVALAYNWWSLFVRCAEPERPRESVTSLPPAEWNAAQWPEFNRAASGCSAASATACSCTGAAGKRNPGTKPPPTSTPP